MLALSILIVVSIVSPFVVGLPGHASNDSSAYTRRQVTRRSRNFSGAALTASPDGSPFNYMSAQISTPDTDYVQQENAPGTLQKAASWIGFGGAMSPTSGILQTGCSVYNDGSGSGTTSSCWYEYFPDPPVFFDDQGFNPSVGDTVLLELFRTSDTSGSVKLTNLSTGDVITADVNAPAGHSVTGVDADWIVENPGKGASNLVNFHSQYFEGCVATTANGNRYGPGDGMYKLYNEYKDIQDGRGSQQWTNSYLPSNSEVQVDFVAPYY